MKKYENKKLFTTNIKYLSKSHPQFLTIFDSVNLTTNLVIDDNGEYDIDVGAGQLLYGNNSKGAAERQVQNYMDSPARYHSALASPTDRASWNYVDNDSPLVTFLEKMGNKLMTYPDASSTFDPSKSVGFLFVFGLGLGFHIEFLAKVLKFRCLVIIEPHDQILLHNLHVMDWETFGKGLTDRGQDIIFIRGENLFDQFLDAAHSKNYPFLGGSYLYSHYDMPELTELMSEISKKTAFIFAALGWTEDQLQMFRNSSINLSSPGFYLQETLSNSIRTLPAIVVGAGPSLDKNIETIKRYQDDAVIISSSSSISALLANNITPHIHCALENIESLGMVLENLSKKHDFSNITLFASFTVNERAAACFKRTVYFFRRDIAASHFFSKGGIHTELAEPLTGNTALLCALSFGFKEVYLFGLDFGARTSEIHHSQHSVEFAYNDDYSTPFEFETSVPGNFGGTVNNGWLLEFSRIRANLAIEYFENVVARNCSDGAYIPSAPPLDHNSLAIPHSSTTPEKEIDAALLNLTYCEKGPFKVERLSQFQKDCQNFLDTCINITKATGTEDLMSGLIINSICEKIIEEHNLWAEKEPAVHSLFKGDIQTVISTIHHYTLIKTIKFDNKVISEISYVLENYLRKLGELVEARINLIIETSTRTNR